MPPKYHGPTSTGIGPRGGQRQGWGFTGMSSMGPAITVREFRRRVRGLKTGVRRRAREMLYAAAEPLRDQWRENIAARGWTGEGGVTEGAFGNEMEYESLSSGRYYNSIVIQATADLELEVGSNIPRPSGRGLTSWSYPEALEYGTSRAPAFPTMTPAFDEAGPKMESKAKEIFDALVLGYMSGRYRA